MIDYDYQTDTPIICLSKYYQMIPLISYTNSAILHLLRNFGLDEVIVTSSSLTDTPSSQHTLLLLGDLYGHTFKFPFQSSVEQIQSISSTICQVKKLVVGFRRNGPVGPPHGVLLAGLFFFAKIACALYRVRVGFTTFTLKKLECSKQAYRLNT